MVIVIGFSASDIQTLSKMSFLHHKIVFYLLEVLLIYLKYCGMLTYNYRAVPADWQVKCRNFAETRHNREGIMNTAIAGPTITVKS